MGLIGILLYTLLRVNTITTIFSLIRYNIKLASSHALHECDETFSFRGVWYVIISIHLNLRFTCLSTNIYPFVDC